MNSTKSLLFPQELRSLTCTVIEYIDLMNIQVSESVSLS